MNRRQIIKLMAVAAVAVTTLGSSAKAQVFNPCPSILINERVDHVPYQFYAEQGWDTVFNYTNHCEITLTAEPYIPVQYFNGTYLVEEIPYHPADSTFTPGSRFQFSSGDDDKFYGDSTILPRASGNTPAFVFYFFGKKKTSFVAGSNGIITFNRNAAGQSCPYSLGTSDILPWPEGSSYHNNAYLHDAILGVYEDTHPIPGTTTVNNNAPRGVYQGVIDEYPCRKIIFSVNDITQYSCSNNDTNRCTYQMVCYEGSNIIELHIKHRARSKTGWNNDRGIIGIINEDGEPQEQGPVGSPNMHVNAGSPASFSPIQQGSRFFTTENGYSRITQQLDSVAFRYTPQGSTSTSVHWYRIFDDGRDSILLTTNVTNPNGYFEDMGVADPARPTLTKAHVKSTEPATYVCHLYFEDAENHPYDLYDTIHIGIDTAKDLYLKSVTPQLDTVRIQDYCNGSPAALKLTWGQNLIPRENGISWRVERIMGGKKQVLPASMYSIDETTNIIEVLPDPRFDTLPRNHIDSIRVMATIDFISGASNFDTFLVRVFPNFDTINKDGVCRGETYHWRPSDTHNHTYDKTYNDNTDPASTFVKLKSVPGCDSTVRLKLTVYDVSYTTEPVESCREIIWRNGREYTESNTATMETDTVVLKNRFDCDSVVQLAFTIYPLRATIDCDVERFTYDNLDAQLTDVSVGLEESRIWLMPALDINGDSTTIESTDPSVFFNMPAKLDGATIKLIATSPYGCQDSTTIYIPLDKETMWIPSAFMPDDPSDNNNIFSSRSINTEQQEMWIYDRSGRLVAHCSGVDCGWDGRDLKGNPCPQGAYVYVIKYTTVFEPKQTLSKHGTVTLIR